jgi:hypothetical protein
LHEHTRHVNTQPRRTCSCLLIILPVLGRGVCWASGHRVCWASGRGVCWASGRGVCWAPRNPFLFNNPFIVAVLGAHIASRLSTSTPGGFGFFILPSTPSGLLALAFFSFKLPAATAATTILHSSRQPAPSPSLCYSLTHAHRSIGYHNRNPQPLAESAARLTEPSPLPRSSRSHALRYFGFLRV